MSESLEGIKRAIDECSEEDRKALRLYLCKLSPHPLEKEWGIDADTILSAINRSSDLTKRGVRGIIAEAVFVKEVAPTASGAGWQPIDVEGDHPYDAVLKKGSREARIQVKLQRLEKGKPKLYYPNYYQQGSLYVAEVQKTRTGEKTSRGTATEDREPDITAEVTKVETRPYNFGDFDILAVSMHPSSGSWRDFRYTLGSWLLARSSNSKLIEVLQPVAAASNNNWTDDLATCLRWLEEGKEGRVLLERLHPNRPRRTKEGEKRRK
ncbi:MAG: hypothetical protein WCA44_12850 [Acidobacteriaceae bacterium]|jgi:hypothetical protein